MLRSIGLGNSYYEFPSRKYRSIEVLNVVFPSGKLGILRAPRLPTRKYDFPSPMEWGRPATARGRYS